MISARFLEKFCLLLTLASPLPLHAILIQPQYYFNYIAVSQPSIFGNGGVALGFGVDLTPTAGTTVSAQQGTTTRNVPFLNSPGLSFFFRSVPYDAALTGAWTLTVTNPAALNSPLVITTEPICPTLCSGSNSPANPLIIPPIKGAKTNSLSTTPTISWDPPAYTAPAGTTKQTQFFIYSTTGSVLYAQSLPPTATSYTVPAGVLVNGQNYVISLQTSLRNTADAGTLPGMAGGSLIEKDNNYFNFTPSAQAPSPPGPINLPVVHPNGQFFFNLAVTEGVAYLLDPTVAIGYDFEVGEGDPLFASVEFPNLGNFNYDLYLWDGTQWMFDALVAPLTLFTFPDDGVARFRVLGIDPGLLLDPANTTAFTTQVTFAGSGNFTGTMTPITAKVPEPATLALLGVGLAGLGFSRRKQ